MENSGAIYTFEYALLLNPAISTQADKKYRMMVRNERLPAIDAWLAKNSD